MEAIKETKIRESIIWYINVIGWWCARVQSWQVKIPNHNGTWRVIRLAEAGTPDILACIAGRFVGIEVKRDDAEVKKWHREQEKRFEGKKFDVRSVNQKDQQDKIQDAGGLFCVICSSKQLHENLVKRELIAADKFVPWL